MANFPVDPFKSVEEFQAFLDEAQFEQDHAAYLFDDPAPDAIPALTAEQVATLDALHTDPSFWANGELQDNFANYVANGPAPPPSVTYDAEINIGFAQSMGYDAHYNQNIEQPFGGAIQAPDAYGLPLRPHVQGRPDFAGFLNGYTPPFRPQADAGPSHGPLFDAQYGQNVQHFGGANTAPNPFQQDPAVTPDSSPPTADESSRPVRSERAAGEQPARRRRQTPARDNAALPPQPKRKYKEREKPSADGSAKFATAGQATLGHQVTTGPTLVRVENARRIVAWEREGVLYRTRTGRPMTPEEAKAFWRE
ncbi:MAG: hypothetical protein M1827_006461 [Pycnora praestabilis]|nr:MAG: hypothetical protein M1827_006461 [Pycnora praestabilis]